MKKILLILALVHCQLNAFEPERIVRVDKNDFTKLESLLKQGYTVKAQSSVLSSGHMGALPEHVFTLTPPTDAVRAELLEKAKARATAPEATK